MLLRVHQAPAEYSGHRLSGCLAQGSSSEQRWFAALLKLGLDSLGGWCSPKRVRSERDRGLGGGCTSGTCGCVAGGVIV